MKIRTEKLSYEQVLKLKKAKHKNPKKPGLLFRKLMYLLSSADLKDTNFTYKLHNMDKIEDGPYFIIMNHSSFIDLEMMSQIFKDHPYNIVCTSDGFVGKEWLMRNLGCIPINKFVTTKYLISDIEYSLNKLKTSVLMYPEASYTFDGCATKIPRKFGFLLKKLNVPVISINTKGAFSRDPLYNCLQKRKVDVSADVTLLFTKDQLKEKSVSEIDAILDDVFDFDNFAWQKENNIKITEQFRADGLERILYKCPNCGKEGTTKGHGTTIECTNCNTNLFLNELGQLEPIGDSKLTFSHIPDWYNWERNEVKKEIEENTYLLDTDVEIGVMVNYDAIYMIGKGHLVHNSDGFHLTNADGSLDYTQSPLSSYGLYADYYWYELGDMICIGNTDILYYCFTPNNVPVAKARQAAEELYKIKKSEKRQSK